jgi:thiamine-monophosphate kinase
VTEDSITQKLRRRSPLIGDDCAVVPSHSGQDLLLKADLSIEGVHFTRERKAEEIGARAVARSLSDIAAMGGTPLYCLVSIALAPWTDERWIDGFYRSVYKLLRKVNASLAGGDISHADQLVCDVILCGSVAKGKALLRSGAKPGDALYVSGPLGGWRNKGAIVPRLELGRQLVGVATACMDISDGLAQRGNHPSGAARWRGLRASVHCAAASEGAGYSDRQYCEGQARRGAIQRQGFETPWI